MATASAHPRRRKQATYGKTSRSVNTWNSTNLDALDEDELSFAGPRITRPTGVKETYHVQKRETKPTLPKPKPAKTREVKQDVWDLTSSESSEDEVSPVRRQPLAKLGGKGKPVKDREPVKLAPWERKKTEVTSPAQRNDAESPPISEEKLRARDNRHATPLASPSSTARNSEKEKIAASPSSAAARLQARRLKAGHGVTSKPFPPHKRAVPSGYHLEVSPRKRLRSDRLDDDDTPMADVSAPGCESPDDDKISEQLNEKNIQLPAASTKNSLAAASKTTNKTTAVLQPNRRGKVTTYSSPRKMESAPARLSEMLPVDADTTDETRSPSTTASRPTTPQQSGRSSKISSPQTAFKTGASNKQNQLWGRLLPDEIAAPSPSVLPMHALNLNSTRRNVGATTAAPRTLLKASSDVGRQRTRLVDRLKASALSSEEDSSEEEVTSSSDVEMSEEGDGEAAASQPSQSQTQSQTLAADSRPKITFAASQRSWLKEESFEDELMLDMPTETLHRTITSPRRAFEKSNSASQKSAFDMEDSDDDEGATVRLRTIHELRAGGTNQRFMDDTGGLLEDASDHKLTARGRRRSALIDIANKLADKAFAAKFYGQGFEQRLMKECTASPDDIADFALAAAIAMLMTADPPEHAAQSLKDGGALTLLIRMLTGNTDPIKLAKDRRNNMSKALQSTFSKFVTSISHQESIWGGFEAGLVTPRILALKALDLLVGKLRRSGDRSEIVDSDEIREILSSPAELDKVQGGEVTADVSLSVSVLESLSTTTISLSWPTELTESLRKILECQTMDSDKSKHLRFLVLRLCLNLTNDNSRSCRAFAKSDTVVALLRSITEGFQKLFAGLEGAERAINSDALVLTMGILINLTEQKSNACEYAATAKASPLLATLMDYFLQGQERTLEAESVEDGLTNVAFGYLAVVLANLCRNRESRQIVASRLPGKKLHLLIDAVQEFVAHHQKVDTLNFEGAEGTEVWSAFTEKLKSVLSRLRAEAEADEIDRRGRD